MTLTPEQLAALREVAEKAQEVMPGPWYNNASISVDCLKGKYRGESVVFLSEEVEEIGNHIAAFDPATCLELLEEVERLTRENEILRNADYSFLQKVSEP